MKLLIMNICRSCLLRDSVVAIAPAASHGRCFPASLAEPRLARDTASISLDSCAGELLEDEAAGAWLPRRLA